MIGYKAFYKSHKPGVLVAHDKTEYIIGSIYHSESLYNFCEMPLDLYRFYPQITYDHNVVRIYTIIKILGCTIYDINTHESKTNKMQIIKILSPDDLLTEFKDTVFNSVCGDIHYLKNGLWHSNNILSGDALPAIIRINGDMEWMVQGKLHRENDMPAIITKNGKYWYFDGMLHRDSDMPAIVIEIKPGIFNEYWYKYGKLHRKSDKPAIIRPGRDMYWYVDGKMHRDSNNPSVILNNGSKFWHKNGILIKHHIVPAVCICESGQHNFFL